MSIGGPHEVLPSHEGSQARLKNDRLMRRWGGAAGYSRLNFCWPVASRVSHVCGQYS